MIFRMVYKSGQIFLPFCHNPRLWQTNRQRTDRRMDSFLIARPRLHCMQRGKTIFFLLRFQSLYRLMVGKLLGTFTFLAAQRSESRYLRLECLSNVHLSVSPSVHHTRESFLNSSKYRNMFCTIHHITLFLEAKFWNPKFTASPRRSALRSPPPPSTAKFGP